MSEAIEIAKNIIHNGGISKDYAKHALDIINPQLVTLAKAHLRASQTPPQAVTREQIIAALMQPKTSSPPGSTLMEIYADAILALLAEKPATSPTPTQDEMFVRCYLYDSVATFNTYADMHRAKETPEGDEKAKRNNDMAKRGYEAFRKYMSMTERLSASPKAPMVVEQALQDHEDRTYYGTAPKGEA